MQFESRSLSSPLCWASLLGRFFSAHVAVQRHKNPRHGLQRVGAGARSRRRARGRRAGGARRARAAAHVDERARAAADVVLDGDAPRAESPSKISLGAKLGRDRARAACAPRRAKILFDVEAPRRVSMLAAMSPSSRGSSRKSINAGAIAPELKAMAEASKRRTT